MNELLYQKIIKQVDFQYIKSIIKMNQNKKIYCFGGGSAAELLINEIADIHFENILDNNEKLEGTFLHGIEIRKPSCISSCEKGTYVVLIISQHVTMISQQLEDYGLEEGKDYFDIYTPLKPYFSSVKIIKKSEKFHDFVNRIPDDISETNPITRKEHVGVVCICEASNTLLHYAITKGLLLRMDGYKVTFIVDSLGGFESFLFFPGVEKILLETVRPTLELIKKKFPEIEIHDIEREGRVTLSQKDENVMDYYIPYIVKWLKGRPEQGVVNIAGKEYEVIKNILKTNLSYVKAYFEKNQFTSIDVRTGIHRHRMTYAYIAKEKGMRCSTSDGDVLYSSEGPAAHIGDIVKLVQGDFFSDYEEEMIVSFAQKDFLKRKNSTKQGDGCSYQVQGYDKHIKTYDIVIPLNIFWDAAALAKDDVFCDEFEWLNETLQYIMKNTNAAVMIREHPAQASFGKYSYSFVDICSRLRILDEYKDRIYFASANALVNTYQYIEACKLVLPYTSTVGFEAVMMGKPIVMHTDVYYSYCDIGYKAKNKNDYFEKIKYYLDNPVVDVEKKKSASKVYYYFQKTTGYKIDFSPKQEKWMEDNIIDMYHRLEVKGVIDLMGKGVPIAYNEIKKQIDNTEGNI